MNSPPISVVMSVYNGERFLAEAVDSVLAQTFKDFEFIIIDDGSTDTTAQILASYSARDSRVRVFTQENRGRAESLNRGIEIARAPLIARMDADDICYPQRLQLQSAFMNAHPDVGLLGTAIKWISIDGGVLRVETLPTADHEIRAAMLRSNSFRHSTVVMRREVFLAAGRYRKALLDADDYDLWLRIAEHSRLANLPEALLSYRVHPGQVSVQNMDHQLLCCYAACAAAACRSRGEPDPLTGIAEITPSIIRSLHVPEREVRQARMVAHLYWAELLADNCPESALDLINRVLRLGSSDRADRSMAAGVLMKASSICYRRGSIVRAALYAARGLLANPRIASRLARMAVARRFRPAAV